MIKIESRGKLFGTFSKEAQIGITNSILQHSRFSDPRIQRRLAIYPFENFNRKNALICELMQMLWPLSEETNCFATYQNFENFLLASGKRGHFIHQFEVFLLGLNVLFKLFKKQSSEGGVFNLADEPNLINTWLLASTMHDFGYPLQIATEMINTLAELYHSLGMTSLGEKFKGVKLENLMSNEKDLDIIRLYPSDNPLLVSSVSLRILMRIVISETLDVSDKEAEEIRGFLENENNHGYVSATILGRTALKDSVRSEDGVLVFKEDKLEQLKQAMGAVSVHAIDLSGEIAAKEKKEAIIRKISFKKNPFAYILFIIDNIQDWSRAIIPNPKHADYQLNDFRMTDNYLKIGYVMYHENWDDNIRNGFKDALDVKRKLISLPKRLSPRFGFRIEVSYRANDSNCTIFEPIIINL